MRSPLASGWGVLVEVDEGAVLALCFLRSWIAVVSFYETATSSPANSLVHIHSWWSRGCPQRGVRKREGDEEAMRGTGCARIDDAAAFAQVGFESVGVLC